MSLKAAMLATALTVGAAGSSHAALSGPDVSGTTYSVFSVPSGVTPLTLVSPTGTYPYGGPSATTPITPTPGLSIDVSGADPAGNGLVQGNGSGPLSYYVAPYETGTTPYAAPYLAPGNAAGKVTYNFSPSTNPFSSFGFLWGSVDDFNRLQITVISTDGTNTTSELTVMGTDLPSSGGAVSAANSYYVIFNTAPGFVFDSIVADDLGPTQRSPQYTFEEIPLFVSANDVTIPEPAPLAVLGIGLAGMVLARRRR